jgi:hypothetical protein
MGAANAKVKKEAQSPKIVEFLPTCIDCGAICEPKNDVMNMNIQEAVDGTRNKPRTAGTYESPAFQTKQPGDIQKAPTRNESQAAALNPVSTFKINSCRSLASPRSQGSPSSQRGQESETRLRRAALSFKGKLSPDWDIAQHERLQAAVEEICRSLKIQPPGPRAMKTAMAAHTNGYYDEESDYDQRSLLSPSH